MKTQIFLSPPDLNPETSSYVQTVLNQNWIAPNGPENQKLEALVANHYQIAKEHVITTNSGTAALHLAYKSIGLNKGDTVLCATNSFVATVNPLLEMGVEPWFVDSETETLGMHPMFLKEAIVQAKQSGKHIKAVVVVDVLGIECKVKEIKAICDEEGLILIQDSAESLGCEIENGLIADILILSFNGNKIITTSGGGAFISKQIKYLKSAKYLRDQAKSTFRDYTHKEVGYNYALSNISAAIGVSEWPTLKDKLEKKKRIYLRYLDSFKNEEKIQPLFNKDIINSNFWMSAFLFENRMAIKSALDENGIESRMMWRPLHQQEYLKEFPSTLNGNSEYWAEHALWLPSGTNLTENDQMKVIDLVTKHC